MPKTCNIWKHFRGRRRLLPRPQTIHSPPCWIFVYKKIYELLGRGWISGGVMGISRSFDSKDLSVWLHWPLFGAHVCFPAMPTTSTVVWVYRSEHTFQLLIWSLAMHNHWTGADTQTDWNGIRQSTEQCFSGENWRTGHEFGFLDEYSWAGYSLIPNEAFEPFATNRQIILKQVHDNNAVIIINL